MCPRCSRSFAGASFLVPSGSRAVLHCAGGRRHVMPAGSRGLRNQPPPPPTPTTRTRSATGERSYSWRDTVRYHTLRCPVRLASSDTAVYVGPRMGIHPNKKMRRVFAGGTMKIGPIKTHSAASAILSPSEGTIELAYCIFSRLFNVGVTARF